jgi:hypothetical protein
LGIPDEGNEIASATLARLRTEITNVPAIWWFEIRNVPLVNERRKRISEGGTTAFLRFVSGAAYRYRPIAG